MRIPLSYFITIILALAASANPVKHITLNHIGFKPEAPKHCALAGTQATPFKIIDVETHQPVYQGMLKPQKGDFGPFLLGRFDDFQNRGEYYIRAGNEESYPFRIDEEIYTLPIKTIIKYFNIQRCGPSQSGYNSPCHLDDAYRVENDKRTDKHMDVTGGWHDASDLRKWVSATIHGMVGLANVYAANPSAPYKEKLFDELKWGNRYFLAMQEPAGYIMNHCAGDVFEHGDQNRWTDNIVGNEDDRLIRTEPCNLTAQYNFIYTEAKMSRIAADFDQDRYAKKCLTAAQKALDWCLANRETQNANELGAAASSCIELFKATGNTKHENQALTFLSTMLDLQEKENDAIAGFFYRNADKKDADRQIFQGCWYLLALCDAMDSFPNADQQNKWRQAINLYCKNYLHTFTSKNAFSIVPLGLFTDNDPAGRQIGNYHYRYFRRPVEGWWVGINANLASHGVGLAKAARLLNDGELKTMAQRQLDWIAGSNPLNASTITDIGYNQPAAFINWREFRPHTPLIPGAVMNGMGGTMNDMPDTNPGGWQTTEYWTPMVGYTVWLMAELQNSN